ncbi:MAG: S8 family serine peptidase [Verrucomicrobiota bacterium]|nr:S8 family serine peptidase [Verrucomicrobiota bacterium]
MKLPIRTRGLPMALVCAALVFGPDIRAGETNRLVWHKTADRVDADLRDMPLPRLLGQIAAQTGWRVYVEPGVTHSASVKFAGLSSVEALRILLGHVNFALQPQANGPPRLLVFNTAAQNATQPVHAARAAPKHVPNELLVKLKPGADIEALAKSLGAKVVGRNDKLGLYLLQFDNAADTDAALAKLRGDRDVAQAGYNDYFNPPPSIQNSGGPTGPPFSLKLKPPGDSGKTIVGLIDTHVQSLGADLDPFLLKQISVAGQANDDGDVTHGTAMAEAMLAALAGASHGSTSVQIQAVDVYGPNPTTTTWNVALGIQAAVDAGANVLNLSLGSSENSPILDDVIAQALADGIPVFAAAGNTPGSPDYPAQVPGVLAVTAVSQDGQLAPYANSGNWVDFAFPGASVIYFDGQNYFVQGTSVSTATATGVAAGNKAALNWSWAQVEAAMLKRFAAPTQ